MKLLLGQNLPSRLLRELDGEFQGSAHVGDIRLAHSDDLEVWEHALRQQYAIVTKDLDFRDIAGLRGFPPKVVLLRWGNITNKELVTRFTASTGLILAFLADDENALLELW